MNTVRAMIQVERLCKRFTLHNQGGVTLPAGGSLVAVARG